MFSPTLIWPVFRIKIKVLTTVKGGVLWGRNLESMYISIPYKTFNSVIFFYQYGVIIFRFSQWIIIYCFKNKDTRFEFSIDFSTHGHSAGRGSWLSTGLEWRQTFSVLITRHQSCPLPDMTQVPMSLCLDLFAFIKFLLQTQLKWQVVESCGLKAFQQSILQTAQNAKQVSPSLNH